MSNCQSHRCWLLLLGLLSTEPARAQMTVLHSFNRHLDGHNPYGTLIQSGAILFGTTLGGQFDYGSVFQIATDGTGFAVVRSFQGDHNGPDGADVQVSLARSGSTLFGTTIRGGIHGGGTIFRMQTDGSGFSFLHSFPDPNHPGDGTGPKPLHLSGSTLYGMTEGNGTIFRIGIDGSGYGIVHSFERIDGLLGTFPSGSPIESGSTLYGMAPFGGSFDKGTVWRVGADGTGFNVLHSFAGPSDGFEPYGNLILSGTALYGMTSAGGSANGGTIFKIGIDGTGYRVLHSLAGSPGDGAGSRGSLIQSGSTLYGMTSAGGSADRGTIFQIDTDGTGFEVLHSFAGGPNDGAEPFGDLLLSGSTLYGITAYGGEFGDGTIFSFNIPEPSSLVLLATAGCVLLTGRRQRSVALSTLRTALALPVLPGLLAVAPAWAQIVTLHTFQGSDGGVPYGSLIQVGSNLYGTTSSGGSAGFGTIFQIRPDGTGFELLHSFDGASGDAPANSLLQVGPSFYGTTAQGGTGLKGTVFRIGTDGTDYQVLYSFNGAPNSGYLPLGALVQSGTALYGTTRFGGSADHGTVFKIGIDGSGFAVLHSFAGSPNDGRESDTSLLLDGSTLYGTTTHGGTGEGGTLFRLNTDGTDYSVLHSFTGGPDDGWLATNSLVRLGSTLYGMTTYGGEHGRGTIFKIQTDGTGFDLLHSFAGGEDDGASPIAEQLILSGSTLYGTTYGGGSVGTGTVFRIETDGTAFQVLDSFTGPNGYYPQGGLLESGATLFGVTLSADFGPGTVFSIAIPEPSSLLLLAVGCIAIWPFIAPGIPLGRRRCIGVSTALRLISTP